MILPVTTPLYDGLKESYDWYKDNQKEVKKKNYFEFIEKNLRWFLDTPTYKVDNYIGKTKKEIKNTQFYNYVFYGDGNTVIYQSPDHGEKIKEGDTIMLYMG